MIDNQYPLDLIRNFPNVQTELLVNDGTEFILGDPGEVVIRIQSEELTVSEYSVVWEGHRPVMHPPQIAILCWRLIPKDNLTMVVQTLIDATSALRRSKYSACSRCKEIKPPEWMHDSQTCQGCAVQYLGVVY